jgi:hypothetical protein
MQGDTLRFPTQRSMDPIALLFRPSSTLGVACIAVALILPLSCDSDSENPPPNAHAGRGGSSTGGTSGASGRAGSSANNEGGDSGSGATSATGGTTSGHGGASNAGESGSSITAGTSGSSGSAQGGASAQAGASGSAHSGESGNAGESGTAGTSSSPPTWDYGPILDEGVATVGTRPRPDWGPLVVAPGAGARRYVIESRRDVETGPFGLPWRSRFRLAAYDAGVEAWSFDADADDEIGGVAVHPSGELTLSVQHQAPENLAYQLVRLAADGEVLGSTTLEEPATPPDTDFAPTDPRPLFRMKADTADATTSGWIPLLPEGEGVATALLSLVMTPPGMPSNKLVLGVITYDWNGSAYVERWARVVEGVHGAQPAAWTYDEFRWREQAIRPWLERDPNSGELLIGRAWNNTRCRANVDTFAEFTAMQCVLDAVSAIENERFPLAVTRFTADGARLGTVLLKPDEDAAEQLPFAWTALEDGRIALAGAVVRTDENGVHRTYPDADGYVDYDGYIAVYSATGEKLLNHDFNLGRGDVLAALRWTDSGFLAVGSSDWDRWQGGMSVSRGSNPLLVWLSPDASNFAQRTEVLSDGARHFTLHDLVASEGTIETYGFSDGPMTHSADGDNTAERTFGPLVLTVAAETTDN